MPETAEQPVERIDGSTFIAPIQEALLSPLGLMMLAASALWAWLALTSGKSPKKGTLARGKLANNRHRRAARQKALRLMQARKHNEIALYIGTPEGASFRKRDGKWHINLPEDPKTLYITDAEAHIAVVGATGCGKSFSFINPAVRSALDQGFPVIYFDLKYTADDPNPTSQLAGYAKERGYRVDVFAPGMPESCRCNPLDLLRDEYDAETARQFATVLHRNFTPANSQDNPFFTQNAQKMIQGVMMLAKRSPNPDLMTARAIARMPNLVQQLESSDLPEVIKSVFDALVSSAGAPETLSGIQATVANMLGNLMTPNVLAALIGETTMPLDLDGRQFLSFGVDGQRRDVVLPMIATLMHLVVNRNVMRARRSPLILVLDEVPSIYLPALADWLNQNRSAGLCCILGFQSFALLEKLYGKTGSEELVTGCTTQAVFQLNDLSTARTYSELLGKEDIRYQQRSQSHGRSGSSSTSQQLQTRSILEANEITTFPKGKCILFNRGYGDSQASRVPYISQIQIPKRDLAAARRSAEQWPSLRDELIERSDLRVPDDAEFRQRHQTAQSLFIVDAEAAEGRAFQEHRQDFLNIEDGLELERHALKQSTPF